MQDNHLDIKFWTQKQYQLAKKNQRKSTSIQDLDPDHNIMTWFVEEDDRKLVDNDMGNWKAHMITTLNYSSWYGKHIRHVMKIKMKPCIKKESKESAKQSAVNKALGTIKHKKAKTDTSENMINKNMINVDDDAQLVQSPILVSCLLQYQANHKDHIHINFHDNGLKFYGHNFGFLKLHALSNHHRNTSNPLPTPKLAVAKPSKKAKAGHALNAKSLCKHKWITSNPNGPEDNFAAYWAGI
ncbi:hypothetical protein H0H87_011165 [Tephrocybe sp. NHM501043]|nr:hypothetical protein H0H87_011165 [Tephrocybe sp. NHM501043]